ncbi:MAG: hypothetical protein DRQ39_08015 [Gammaproteobacteria bacterium]|nr:MAG: hypothetical protein DRQ39_08015 [Gammaproteobacteria bacterium]
MRKYGTIPSLFWDDPKINLLEIPSKYLALYLRTNNHSNMIHLYRINRDYALSDTGLTSEQYDSAIIELETIGYCHFDHEENMVWLREAMIFDMGYKLNPKDKRVKGLKSLINLIPECRLKSHFLLEFNKDYRLGMKPPSSPLVRGLEVRKGKEQSKRLLGVTRSPLQNVHNLPEKKA